MLPSQPTTIRPSLDSSFRHLSHKALNLLDRRRELDKDQLHVVLNDLNSLDFRYHHLQDSLAATDLISTLTATAMQLDEPLVMKISSFLRNMFWQQISLTSDLSNQVVRWLLTAVEANVCETLNTLQVVLKHCQEVGESVLEQLIGSRGILLETLLDPKKFQRPEMLSCDSNSVEEINVAVVRCIEAVFIKLVAGGVEVEVDRFKLPELGDKILAILYKAEPDRYREEFALFVTSSLSCLKCIVYLQPEWGERNIGALIGCSMCYMRPLPVWERPKVAKISQQHIPELPTAASHRAGKPMKLKRKVKRRQEGGGGSGGPVADFELPRPLEHHYSDSDYSETEQGAHNTLQHRSKSRQSALNLLLTLAQAVDKTQLFGFWHSLVREGSEQSLLHCVQQDPSKRCRISALQTLTLVVYKCRLYLAQAEHSDTRLASFTPFSIALGNSLTAVFEVLTTGAATERDPTVLTQVLKCLSVLVAATPFHRLRRGIIVGFTPHLRALTEHKDLTVKVAIMNVMGALFAASEVTEEALEAAGTGESPWLVEFVVAQLLEQTSLTATAQLRIECLQLLRVLSGHIQLVIPHLDQLGACIKTSLQDSSPDIVLHAARAIDALGQSINKHLDANPDASKDTYLSFWLLLPAVVAQVQNIQQSANIRSTCCDALGTLGAIYELLDRDKQMLLVSLLSGTACDEITAVRASAIRTLSICTQFPSLQDDLCFIENTLELVVGLLHDSNLLSRTQASWSLGNVSDILVAHPDTPIGETLFKRVLTACLEGATDHEKVRSNAIRALGNLVRLVRTQQLATDKNLSDLCRRAILAIADNVSRCGNMKVKWNSCYALGNLMRNPAVFTDPFNATWQKEIFTVLCDVVSSSKNFKVRINAAIALAVPIERSFYGGHFVQVWRFLILALAESGNLVDYNEYKHKDGLQEQLCVSIGHLLKLAGPEDLVAMRNELVPLYDVTKANWERTIYRLTPEKSMEMSDVESKLLEMERSLGGVQRAAVEVLKTCFLTSQN